MRKIEEKILSALADGRHFENWTRRMDNTDCRQLHDEILVLSDHSAVVLCDSIIAKIYPTTVIVDSDGWRTPTTKSRLNAILQKYCGTGIAQKSGAWTIGGRAFEDGMSIPRKKP